MSRNKSSNSATSSPLMTPSFGLVSLPPSRTGHADRAPLARAARQTIRRPQNAMPNSARYARGATKCVPEQVDRKLNSASLLVTFRASNRNVQCTRSV